MLGDDGGTWYEVKWKGYTKRHNSWIPAKNLNAPEILQRFKEREQKKRQEPVLNSMRSRLGEKLKPQVIPVPERPQTEETWNGADGRKEVRPKQDWVPKTQQMQSGRISRNWRLEEGV